MNVLFVALGVYSREGGIERFNRRVLECLAEGRAAGTVSAATAIALWDEDVHAAFSPEPIDFVPCSESKLGALRAFVRALRQDPPDVVVYGHVLLAPLAIPARLLRGRARNVLVAHGYEVWDRPGPLRRAATARTIDHVASVSDYTATRMGAAYALSPQRFVRVINALDVTDPPPVAARTGRRLLTVSRLNPLDRAKHVDKVIEALPLVLERLPDARLDVVGDGELRPELDALVRALGLEEHVRLLGTVPDEERDALYAESDVFVLPSTQEGFGIVYLEAWLHGLPVVAGAGGAAPEVVSDGVTGLVVEPVPEAIAAAVVRLLEDPALARRLADAGRDRLVRSYTGAHFDAAFLKMLETVVIE